MPATSRRRNLPRWIGGLVLLMCSSLQGQTLTPAASDRISVEEKVAIERAYQPNVGSWGKLSAKTLVLEPPQRLVKKFADDPVWRETPVWMFKGQMAHVLEMLETFGLDSKWATKLKDKRELLETVHGVEIRPPEKFLRQLSSEQREILYGYVAPFDVDNLHHNPFGFHPNGFRFMHAKFPMDLPEAMIDQIDALSFQRKKKGHFFSDLHLCLKDAANEDERRSIVRAIGRQFSLLVQLQVPSDDESLRDLYRYWGSSGRNADVLPLLESVAKARVVEMLDIVHLLPPVPRQLLNSYPTPEMLHHGERPDCFSTSVSFFADEPPLRHLDSVVHVAEARYEKASPPWQLGDLILMRNPDSEESFEHACNYVAADIVFTKNGSDLMRPWMLARLSDVMNGYITDKRLSASFYRLKPEFRR